MARGEGRDGHGPVQHCLLHRPSEYHGIPDQATDRHTFWPITRRTAMQKSENKKTLEPEFQGFICAPSGIRTLDTLIKSQLL